MRKDPTARALALLSLLQTHRLWSSTELADRLDTTERTVRRDVDRLRELGYPVDATSGKHGGYRLQAGAHLPPLVLDDDEAVAVAIGLSLATKAAISGMEETSLRALATIERLLPHRLRRRVSAVHAHVAILDAVSAAGAVDPGTLSVLAAACRDGESIRFDYRRGDGMDSRRLVDPHQLVSTDGRWYLVAWDQQRADWRTFRLDRIRAPRPVGGRFAPREIPGGDAGAFVAGALASMPRPHAGILSIAASPEALADALRWADHTVLEPGASGCRVEIRGDDLPWLTWVVARIALVAPVTVESPVELHDAVRELGARLAGPPPPRAATARQN
ncbi:helix-turn-helix transcriptional regulator [Demequina activiva]|uniref:DeoR family transcriptional regulator n=1 Tax=Demequina activiva TaxID=1582364 RepID=A0A919Q2X4_9MICO|nr:YafY family protein [Demequina activiva]GIG53901.1 DeoR family transcriptional regulator [Demequina activiva]